MATKLENFNTKLAKIRNRNVNVAPIGVIQIAQFNAAVEIYSTPTPAMVTKWMF